MIYCLVGSTILLLCSSPQIDIGTVQVVSSSSESVNIIDIADTTPHAPINISSNQDFIAQGWPGNGTQIDPYMIEGFQIEGGSSCINISSTNVFFIIRRCVLERDYSGRGYCIYLDNVTNGAIRECIIQSNERGIFLRASDSCSIENCQIDVQVLGVYFECCLASSLINSTLSCGGSAVFSNHSTNLEVISNDIDIGFYGYSGIEASHTVGFRFFNNTVYAYLNLGIGVHYSSSGVIANNSLRSCFYGIWLDNATNCDVLMNEAFDNWYGFIFEGTHGCKIELNSIHDNHNGIWTWGSNDTYSKNWFSANWYSNAVDNGEGNQWYQNWWDDYVGYGLYPLLGSAGSHDIDPLPKNDTLFIVTTISLIAILLVSVFFVVTIINRVRKAPLIDANSTDWNVRERLTLPLVVLLLIPSGVSLYTPIDNPARPFIFGITPFGVLSWRAYPIRGHAMLEFISPFTENIEMMTFSFEIIIFYILTGIAWSLLLIFAIRRF